MAVFQKKFIVRLITVVIAVAVLAWLDAAELTGNDEASTSVASSTDSTKIRIDSLLIVSIPDGTSSQIIDYTGFKVSFNSNYKVPNWVAWELTAEEADANVASRKNTTFMRDPKAKGCATVNDYKKSGFDRGHMCPAADMKWNQRAMNDCFLLTNICPQENGLNTGSWNTLENRCRSWAQRDSAVIIVCGPVLTDRITRHIGPSQVVVPERFFKAVLAPYAKPMRAIGFIMPNMPHPPSIQESAVSIDEIEAITGLDLFSWLPDDIENEIEATCNFPLWNKR